MNKNTLKSNVSDKTKVDTANKNTRNSDLSDTTKIDIANKNMSKNLFKD